MRDPFFFLHIPRTAGTTVNTIIRNNFDRGEVLSVYDASDYERRATLYAEELDGVRVIQGHLFLERYDPPQIYSRNVRVFTFLRDPVQRLVSEYLFLRHWDENHLYELLNREDIGFEEYLTSDRRELRFRGKNFMTRMISGMDFDTSRMPRAALAAAKRNLERVFGFVGVQERFDESLLLLKDFMGLRSIFYERRNALRPGLKDAVGEEGLRLARRLNEADAELHAFALRLFDERVRAQGPGFVARLEEFRTVNAKYGRICELISRKEGLPRGGDIDAPKDGYVFQWLD